MRSHPLRLPRDVEAADQASTRGRQQDHQSIRIVDFRSVQAQEAEDLAPFDWKLTRSTATKRRTV
jgi:hypothetical protein